MSRSAKGYLCVVFSAFLFGCMPLLARYIYAEGVNSLSLVFFRNALSLPFLFFMLHRRKTPLRMERKKVPMMIWVSLLGGSLTSGLLFSSYRYVSAGTATTLHFSYPVFVIIGCVLFYREKMTAISAGCILLCTIGIYCFYVPGESEGMLGMVLAFLSGITFAGYTVLLAKSSVRELSAVKLSFYMSVVCSVASLIMALAFEGFTLPTSLLGWVLCIGFAFMLTVVAVVLFQQGTFIVGPQKAAILSTVEPLTSIATGALFFQEVITLKIGVGAILILCAVLLQNVASKEEPTKGSAA